MGKSGHWIVLIDIDAETVTYLDPQFPRSQRRPSRLPLPDFAVSGTTHPSNRAYSIWPGLGHHFAPPGSGLENS